MGADVVIDYTQEDPIAKVKALTEGRGADVAIEALGIQETFENCLKAVRPAGVVSSLGVYGDKVTIPLEPFIYGIGDIDIRTTLCPGGKKRLGALMNLVRPAASTSASWSPTGSPSTRSRRPTRCSPTRRTG